ncbi:MAG: glutamate ligase domain-containing protein, partial [Spartobacteria bacterium]
GSVLRLVDKPTDFSVSLPGSHQLWNAALAIAALEVSGLNCPPAAIQKGLLSVKWPARFQRVGERFVIDGAHNEHSAEALVATWIEVFGNQKASIVFGALRDKEYANMLRLLEKIGHQFFFVPVQSERSEDPAHFKKSTNLPATAFDDLPGAIKAASEASSPVLITGSLFLAGEALTILETLNSQAEG